jgi:hypothetical protein
MQTCAIRTRTHQRAPARERRALQLLWLKVVQGVPGRIGTGSHGGCCCGLPPCGIDLNCAREGGTRRIGGRNVTTATAGEVRHHAAGALPSPWKRCPAALAIPPDKAPQQRPPLSQPARVPPQRGARAASRSARACGRDAHAAGTTLVPRLTLHSARPGLGSNRS